MASPKNVLELVVLPAATLLWDGKADDGCFETLVVESGPFCVMISRKGQAGG